MSQRHRGAGVGALLAVAVSACASNDSSPPPGASGGTASNGVGGNAGLEMGGAMPGAGGSGANGAGASSAGSPAGDGGQGGPAGRGGTPLGAGGSRADGGIAGVGIGGIAGAGNAGGSAGSSGAPGGGNCGTRGGMRGKTSRKLMVGSASRSYVAYLPQSLNPSTPVPFVYVFHGASQNGSWLYDSTEYAKIADSDGIAVVFPDGQGVSSQTMTGSLTPWHVSDGAGLCGLGTLVSNPNPVDLQFVDAIKADIKQDQCIDDKHVYATGFSMGGYFSHHIACNRPDFRAAAPHSGGTMASLDACKTTRMPIIIFHGTADPLINNACDDPAATPQTGFEASATLWAKRNGCKNTYTTVPANGTMGNNGQCYVYDGCPPDGQVEACTFTNMAHAWAGSPVCQGCIGSGTGFASATQLEWAFFKKYAW
jgi:poly(3-hydroxybutyrate) depolymerase